ncbi:Hypothetical predicted protein [Cloeon dipterum]|uniref:Uncharacterized protein n=1 Tax=Cloeon dipterum TaxID=197152 RepID=A0A8S1DY69_9INSE|nr:Hypothetical predicted protein [Cloeon dipterum]
MAERPFFLCPEHQKTSCVLCIIRRYQALIDRNRPQAPHQQAAQPAPQHDEELNPDHLQQMLRTGELVLALLLGYLVRHVDHDHENTQ